MCNTLESRRFSLGTEMPLPASMNAVEIVNMGPEGTLRVTKRAVPRPKPGEVLIRVEAIGVCRPDSLQRRGMHPPPMGESDLPGLEVAGRIVDVTADVRRWKPDDAVCALLPGGGYAEYAVAPQQTVLPIPRNWSAVDAATLPENFFTVWDNVFRRARLAAGEILLAHGGTSGIGSSAIMLARAFGARALATAGSDKKLEACLHIGAEMAIHYRNVDFVAAVMRHTDGRGVDVVVDIVGRDYVQRSLDVLALEGRLVHLATQGADKHATLDMSTLLKRRATIIGSALRHRTNDQKGEIAAGLLEHVWPKLPARAAIAPLVDSVHPLKDAARVHEYFDSGAHIGKIVLTP
jgi:putative PIG3 family NAD(P)H quinone oxidoreductase